MFFCSLYFSPKLEVQFVVLTMIDNLVPPGRNSPGGKISMCIDEEIAYINSLI